MGQLAGILLICGQTVLVQTESSPTLLRWKFQPGDQYFLVYHQTTLTAVTAKEQQNPIRNKLELITELRWKVDALLTAGDARIEQSFTRFKIKMVSAGGAPVEYDSDSSEEPHGVAAQLAQQLEPLLQSESIVILNAQGEVVSVKVSRETEKRLAKLGTRTAWKRILTQDGMEELLRYSLPPLPSKRVANGAAWQRVHTLSTPFGEARQTNNYQWHGVKHEQRHAAARIAVTTETDYPRSAGVKAHEQKGDLFFNPDDGHLVRSELQQHLESESVSDGVTTVASVDSRLRLTVTRRAAK